MRIKNLFSSLLYNQNFKQMLKQAQDGDFYIQNKIGDMYRVGTYVAQDYEEALYWYERAANGGYVPAQTNLAQMYENGHGTKIDYEKAIFWYEKAAKKSDLIAQNALAWIYEKGLGVEVDYNEAYKWYKIASLSNDPSAIYFLGMMHKEGRGVERDLHIAFEYFNRASKLEYAPAMTELALMYQDGEIVDINHTKAFKLLEKSAQMGYVLAYFYLGQIYEYKKDYKNALICYRKSIEVDIPKAFNNLGLMFALGQGVQKDALLAYALLNISTQYGYSESSEISQILSKGFSAQEIEEATSLSGDLEHVKSIVYEKISKVIADDNESK